MKILIIYLIILVIIGGTIYIMYKLRKFSDEIDKVFRDSFNFKKDEDDS